ncbi:zinc ABC transporter substrate-binding protein [Cereibacter changlensis JA139]|uniref:High-affinity zinc uptake system protein ZnuA n=2 Tax=Cereibacter changlensis TaxID=402884 RepID=A0A2T4JWK2_9RHOB|nr:zinc ABC transporter substrate-binding protein [Cereibacter changlensis]PTE22133.1 zinc ABC transporter substrate-binding protein [Cereibacter changlensis JA139]PZX57466.1 zinc transport system substrate-binding protein [Cereibacter changlensis]
MRYTISSAVTSLLIAPAALAEVPLVVTDIPPVHSLVAQVMGDLGAPELLLDRGADAHSFQLRPSQARSLSTAGLVIWIGPEMTPWLDRTLGSLGAKAQLRLSTVAGLHVQDYGDAAAHEHEGHEQEEHADHDHAEHAHEEHAEHDHAEHEHEAEPAGHDHDAEEASHEGHSHSGLDPHLWLDPANARLWLPAIAAELGKLDPENAATYAANAEAAAAGVARLDAETAARLEAVQDRPFVVFHDAYGYFAAHYGLEVAGTVAIGDASAPGAARLSALREELAAEGAVCIFPEVQHDPKLVAQLAEGTPVKIGAPLDPQGAQLEPGAGLYAELMTGLATTLTDCLAER